MFSVLVCATESALTAFNGTESQVLQAVTACLKYAPDRKGGGGRSAQHDVAGLMDS